MVFASLPLHAFFGVVLMGTQTVLGETFYKSLQLYWHTDLLGDQRLGGGIAWAAGEVPLVVVMIALLVQWTRSDRRTAKRLDRAADRDDDADAGGLQRDAGRTGAPRRPLDVRSSVGLLHAAGDKPCLKPTLDAELANRARRDGGRPAAVPADVRSRGSGAVAAERGSPCAVVEFDLAELHRRGQGSQEPAERGRGQSHRWPSNAAPGALLGTRVIAGWAADGRQQRNPVVRRRRDLPPAQVGELVDRGPPRRCAPNTTNSTVSATASGQISTGARSPEARAAISVLRSSNALASTVTPNCASPAVPACTATPHRSNRLQKLV